MKKMLKGLTGFAVVLVLVVGMVATVFAATSKSDGVEVTSDESFTIDADATALAGKTDGWTPLTTEQAASMIGGGVKASELTIIWQKVITGEPGAYTFTYDALTADQTLYVFHNSWQAKDEWDGPVATGAKGSKTVTATFSSLSPIALVVYTPAGATATGGTSPKTGEMDYLLFAALAAVLVGGIVAGIAIRKNKA